MTRFDRTQFKTGRARRLRRDATKPEAKLWYALRGDRLGVSFRRQHPIGPFILDFYSPVLKLAIEVDGGQHFDRQDYDERRTKYLNTRGIEVLRFTNGDVLDGLDAVFEIIERKIAQLTPTRNASRSDLPLSGGGSRRANP